MDHLSSTSPAPDPERRVRLRSIAFPVEHGGWGFLAEPILLALALAPSGPGFAIGIATSAAFLLRHPSKMYWRNRKRLGASARYPIAGRFALLYGTIAVGGLAYAAWAAGPGVLVPFLALAPFLLLFGLYDSRNRARDLVAELAAPMGLAASAPAIAVAGGWGWPEAWALWVLLQARAVPSILYVRARLRLERGQAIDRMPSTMAHVAAIGVGSAVWWYELGPLLTVFGLTILFVRSVRGLSAYRRKAKAKEVGFSELGFGLGYVLLTAIGYRVGL